MPIDDLKGQISRLPEQPGVYIFIGRGQETLYVGKARVLRDRVRSYLGAWGSSPRHDALLAEADRLEVVVTDSVVEALALENHLIKQRMPRYNILLRDDKTYPYLRLTMGEPFPRVLVARRVEADGSTYAGPYMPASLARRTMSLTHRLFGIRSCNEEINGRRGRPCLEYDIGRCVAPCVESICTAGQYRQTVDRARLFLEGRSAELLDELEAAMRDAASAERFEQAAQLRDALRTVQTLRERQQKMATSTLGDRDAFGLKTGPSGSVIQVFQMRGGRVIERIELVADAQQSTGLSEEDVLQAAVQQFYESHDVPPEIHLPAELDEADWLEDWLSTRAGRRAAILVPRRGEKRGLLDLATRNAAIAYRSRFAEGSMVNHDALEQLRGVLALPSFPRRIECFDISTLMGRQTVASMVVCEDGRMRKGEYRKFRIRGPAAAAGTPGERPVEPPGPDDFAAMHEVVHRRYRRVLEQGGPFPDLILIDGGKGQLSASYEALESIGLANLVAVGLAKKEELIVTRDRSEPIAFARDNPALLLLQRIRDEAHRFAVTFHRKARGSSLLHSDLDEVPGVGPKRRRALLGAFGSVAGVRRASREALTAVVGPKAADVLLAHFASTS